MIHYLSVFPKNIVAGFSTRQGGVSQAPFASFNLALHVNDNESAVLENRQRLAKALQGASQWQWLNQIHSAQVLEATGQGTPDADASFSRQQGMVCAVLTADCLPILLSNRQGTQVAAIHAGWRGLCAGIIENTLACFNPADELVAYLGPAIAVQAFEVGEEVRQAFLQAPCGDLSQAAFYANAAGKYQCDLYQLARIRLNAHGVDAIDGGDACTYSDAERFYSYRRDGQTGRMLSFIYRLQE